MKPIETIYNGCRFRSRLEARWAVFLDVMCVPYEYEKEGFDLGGLWYLPDFWLPLPAESSNPQGSGYWLEIKPSPPTNFEIEKIRRLVEQTRHNAYLFAGSPMYGKFQIHKWAVQRRTGGLINHSFRNGESFVDLSFLHQWDGEATIDAALEKASQARFEFGEKG